MTRCKKKGKKWQLWGTVIISFSTQALLHQVIRKVVVIETQIYDARM